MKKIFSIFGKRSKKNMLEQSDKAVNLDRRGFISIGAVATLSATVVGRLSWLQILQNKKYTDMSLNNQYRKLILIPERGFIVDAEGDILAKDKLIYGATISYSNRKKISSLIYKINDLLDQPIKDIDIHIKKVQKESDKYKYAAIVLKKFLSNNEISRILHNKFFLPEVQIRQINTREYFYNGNFAHVTGYVSENLNKQEQKRIGRDVYSQKDFKWGQAGIEKTKNIQLFGKIGYKTELVNAYGKTLKSYTSSQAIRGQDVKLTISSKLQNYAAKLIGDEKGAIIALNARDGSIVTMYSSPSYDANIISRGYEYAALKGKSFDDINRQKEIFYNKTISKTYPPGSIFKIISILTALHSGIDVSQKFTCRGKLKIGNKYRHCHVKHGHGTINLQEAFGRSCNCYFYNLAKKIDIDDFYYVAHELGFDQSYSIANVKTSKGFIPSYSWARKKLGGWYLGDMVNAAIGQGFLEVTPLHLSLMISRIVSAKKVVPDLTNPENKQFEDVQISKSALEKVKKLLLEPFNDKMGTTRFYKSIEDKYQMGGKTGTAQVVSRRIDIKNVREGNYIKEELPHSLFTGLSSIDDPRIAITVVLENVYGLQKSATRIARLLTNFAIDNEII